MGLSLSQVIEAGLRTNPAPFHHANPPPKDLQEGDTAELFYTVKELFFRIPRPSV